MIYYINLLTKEKSKYRIYFGILVILFSISWIIFSHYDNDTIRIFDWLYFAVFIILGIVHIVEGTGISLEEIFGAKAFVHINSERICIKLNAFKKEKIVNWNEIKDIEYMSALYKITKFDNSLLVLELPTENYNQVQRIKETIQSFATENGIQVQQKKYS